MKSLRGAGKSGQSLQTFESLSSMASIFAGMSTDAPLALPFCSHPTSRVPSLHSSLKETHHVGGLLLGFSGSCGSFGPKVEEESETSSWSLSAPEAQAKGPKIRSGSGKTNQRK